MDQRNAGASTAPVSKDDGWHSYTSDHVALIEHLGLDPLHVIRGCIGGPYSFGVIRELGDRICSAVLQQSIGVENNMHLFFEMFDVWANPIKHKHPQASETDWTQFRSNMFEQEFLYNVDRDFVRSVETPLLVLMGSDPYHPEGISREIVELAQNSTLIENRKEPATDGTVEKVLDFLKQNTP